MSNSAQNHKPYVFTFLSVFPESWISAYHGISCFFSSSFIYSKLVFCWVNNLRSAINTRLSYSHMLSGEGRCVGSLTVWQTSHCPIMMEQRRGNVQTGRWWDMRWLADGVCRVGGNKKNSIGRRTGETWELWLPEQGWLSVCIDPILTSVWPPWLLIFVSV